MAAEFPRARTLPGGYLGPTPGTLAAVTPSAGKATGSRGGAKGAGKAKAKAKAQSAATAKGATTTKDASKGDKAGAAKGSLGELRAIILGKTKARPAKGPKGPPVEAAWPRRRR